MGNLGGLLQDMGDLEGAKSLLVEALQGSRETLGDRHPRTLISVNNLCGLLKALCNFTTVAKADFWPQSTP